MTPHRYQPFPQESGPAPAPSQPLLASQGDPPAPLSFPYPLPVRSPPPPRAIPGSSWALEDQVQDCGICSPNRQPEEALLEQHLQTAVDLDARLELQLEGVPDNGRALADSFLTAMVSRTMQSLLSDCSPSLSQAPQRPTRPGHSRRRSQ